MIRSALFGVTASVFLLAASCSQEGPGTGTPSSGGSGGGSGGSSSSGGAGSGGTTSSGGTTASGGTTSSGGSSQSGGDDGSGGASDEGGTTSSGGSARSGGTTARGGSSTASGGTTSPGGTTASGGSASGGATTPRGTGGATQGTGGRAGTGGATGTGGSTAGTTPADIVPDLAKGFYWEGTCVGPSTGHNCWYYETNPNTCPTNGVNRELTQKVGGESGKKYTVNIEVRGVVGTRCYKGGTRASNVAAKEDDYNNWWYAGGTYANPTGWWNTYELKVTPATGDADQYYFNGSDNDGGNYCEREATYLVKYTASFKVMGGGTLTFKIHDHNCKSQQNCGKDTNQNAPCSPRTVDLSGMTPQPSGTFKNPPTNVLSSTFYPQWMYIVATSVTSG